MGNKVVFRPRNPEATKEAILAAARAEFAEAGLAGARVDSIAERSNANKRMIYHYFGGKEELFSAVIISAYEDLRLQEKSLSLENLPAMDAICKLVEFTWTYYIDNPEFITLVNSENLHKAKHIAEHAGLRELQQDYANMVAAILKRGVKEGVFRPGVDPVQFCITLAAIGYYYFTNRYTGEKLFGFDFMDKKALKARLKFNLETIKRLLAVDPT
jgi:AcrR family transcriptional regulator